MSYAHGVSIFAKASNFDESINDHVITQLQFVLTTADVANNNVNVSSGLVILDLPAPDANNFVPYAQVTKSILFQWIEQNYDIIALQDSNISKFQ